jgi:hypothetical protein
MDTRNRLSVVTTMILLQSFMLLSGCDLDCTIDGLDRWNDDCGASSTREISVRGYNKIECDDAFDLTIRQGDDYRMNITIPERLDENRVVRRDGDRLRIGLDGCSCSGVRRATVELPALRFLAATGASRVTMERIRTSDALTLEISGASSVRGELSADETRIHLTGASRAELRGMTADIDLTAAGASQARLVDLEAQTAKVRLSGVSVATVWVREHLDVEASGASRLEYRGSPRIGRLDLSSGSRIEQLE